MNEPAEINHDECEFHCEGCSACLTQAELNDGLCAECVGEPDCWAARTGEEWEDVSWKNCPCGDCQFERLTS